MHPYTYIFSRIIFEVVAIFKCIRNCDSKRLKSPATRELNQQLLRANNKENIKATRYSSFVQGIHQWPVDSPDKWLSNLERVSMSWRHQERKKYRPMVRLCKKIIISIRNILWRRRSQEIPSYLHYSNSGGYSNGVMIKKEERKGQTKINALSIGMILRIKGIEMTGSLKDIVKSRWLSMTFPKYMCYRHISGGFKRRKIY